MASPARLETDTTLLSSSHDQVGDERLLDKSDILLHPGPLHPLGSTVFQQP